MFFAHLRQGIGQMSNEINIKTCGDCDHFISPENGKRGCCEASVPAWVWEFILTHCENSSFFVAYCLSTDPQAENCERFVRKVTKELGK